MISRTLLSSISLCLALLAGCDSGRPLPRPEGFKVSGKVLLPSGAPLEGGTLILRPEGGLYGATAVIQSDGAFTLQDTAENQDVVAGKYQVFVSFPNASHANLKKKVSRRYQESEDSDSDVFVEIKDSTDQLLIRLKG